MSFAMWESTAHLPPPVRQGQMPSLGCHQGNRRDSTSDAPQKPFARVDRVCVPGRACLSRLPTSQAARHWEVRAASGTTGSRSGLEVPPPPDGALQIEGLEKGLGLFLIETMTSFHLGVPRSEPCFCGDTASLSSAGPSVCRS